ncbi:TPA: hypothetical protein TXT45_000337 [Streptococcus suis]|uniref:hypothetical protein n=1 Tax=Streptococcus suis TaxID=1307 RepID=UPI0005BB2F3B|nr:hypothetical protein [Streptococcus suis]MCQ8270660.1 hypothetical protein [Streptococcus suis]MEE3745482.1 hypothetical protein [Streptococcus suis]NQH41252.1 hypothetical protein [Streptococcus suis]NQH55075.1 hypothetical protein [Streptococcus suis]NQN62683.1 hypothetical protein [Streptococcus suis]
MNRYKALVWSDTANSPFTSETIARRLLCYDFDFEMISEITTLDINTIRELRKMNDNLFIKVESAIRNMSILIEDKKNPELLCSDVYPTIAIAEIFGLTIEQADLLSREIMSGYN